MPLKKTVQTVLEGTIIIKLIVCFGTIMHPKYDATKKLMAAQSHQSAASSKPKK